MKRSTTSREFGSGFALATLLAAALLASAGANQARADTTVRLGKSSPTAINFMPVDVGNQAGIFKRNGLEVEVLDFGGSAKLQQAMIADSVDFGLGAGPDIAFLVKGSPVIAVGALALTPALFGIVVPYDSQIHQLSDLKGKRIGISTVGSLTQWLVLQLVQKEGWQPSDVTMITDGSSTTPQIAALKTGEIDAQVGAAAMGWNLEERKEGRLLAPASDFVGPFLMNVIFATNKIVKSDPDAVRAFLKGWYESVDYMLKHRAETIAIASKIDHFAQTVQEKQYDGVMPSLSTDGKFPPEAVAKVRHSFVELDILPEEPDMAQYLTERFLPKTE